MLALYRCDRQAEALQAYQDARSDACGGARDRAGRAAARARTRDPRSGRLPSAGARARAPNLRSPRQTRPGARSSAATGSSASWWPAWTARSPGTDAWCCSPASPASARAAWPTRSWSTRAREGRSCSSADAGRRAAPPPTGPGSRLSVSIFATPNPDALRAQLGSDAAVLAQLLPELREQFPELAEPPRAGGRGRALSALRSRALVPAAAPRRIARSSSSWTTCTRRTSRRSCSFSSWHAASRTAGCSSWAHTATSIRRFATRSPRRSPSWCASRTPPRSRSAG